MADQINAKGSDSKFRPHPEGSFVAKCVDTIDLGEKVEDFIGNPKKLTHKCALVFRTGEQNEETHEVIDIAQEFTVSMGEKANLRKFLEQWRGKSYGADDVEGGVPLHKLVGNWALLGIQQTTSKNNRKYAKIISAVAVPKQMAQHLPALDEYKRAEYWEEKKAGYRKDALQFRAEAGVDDSGDPVPSDAGVTDDDDLPF